MAFTRSRYEALEISLLRRGHMHAELDYHLTHDQWETLKALRGGAPQRRLPSRVVVNELVALGLATMDGGRPLITAKGRSVLLRGSPQLLDLAS
jgi:hypothetical protein